MEMTLLIVSSACVHSWMTCVTQCRLEQRSGLQQGDLLLSMKHCVVYLFDCSIVISLLSSCHTTLQRLHFAVVAVLL